jgi:hypothetical protein
VRGQIAAEFLSSGVEKRSRLLQGESIANVAVARPLYSWENHWLRALAVLATKLQPPHLKAQALREIYRRLDAVVQEVIKEDEIPTLLWHSESLQKSCRAKLLRQALHAVSIAQPSQGRRIPWIDWNSYQTELLRPDFAVWRFTREPLRPAELSELAPMLSRWASKEPKDARQAWRTWLQRRAEQPRPDFLEDLTALLALTLALAGTTHAPKVMTQAILDVGDLWP